MNDNERDEIKYQLLHPVTGAEIGVFKITEVPAEILQCIQLVGQAPRMVIIDPQKEGT